MRKRFYVAGAAAVVAGISTLYQPAASTAQEPCPNTVCRTTRYCVYNKDAVCWFTPDGECHHQLCQIDNQPSQPS